MRCVSQTAFVCHSESNIANIFIVVIATTEISNCIETTQATR